MTEENDAIIARYKSRQRRRAFFIVIIGIVITLFFVEIVLRIADPFGAVYFVDIVDNFYGRAIEDPRGYVVPEGEYHASHWNFNILADNTRAVPDTNINAEKTLVFVGDSLTFGYGVDDAETFVNLVARAYPDWHVINNSYPGWSIRNLENAAAMYPDADLIFVLTISNDLTEVYVEAGKMNDRKDTYLQIYARIIGWVFFGYPVPSEETIAAFEPIWHESITRIGRHPQVTFLTVDTTNDYEQRVLALFPDRTFVLENYTGFISLVDSHPNPASHVFLAEQIIPIVGDVITQFEAQ